MPNTNIDIIIVTYNAKQKLKRCIESIRKHTRDINYKLTVVDNNSRDGTAEFLKGLRKDINIITNRENYGFSGGANAAIKATSCEYMAFVDDDAEVSGGWLKRLYEKINKSSDIGIVGCKALFPNNKIFCAEIDVGPCQVKCVGKGEINKGQRDYVKEAHAVVGTCWLMRRGAAKKIGFFDERFFPSQYEDVDYCLRARLAGYRVVYDGGVDIVHHHLLRSGGARRNRENYQKFLAKWKGLKDFEDPSAKVLLAAAIKLEQKGNYTAAIERFKKLVYLNPHSYEGHYHLTVIYKKVGQLKNAKTEADRSLDILRGIANCKKFLTNNSIKNPTRPYG